MMGKQNLPIMVCAKDFLQKLYLVLRVKRMPQYLEIKLKMVKDKVEIVTKVDIKLLT